jgi:hypothetical protein
MMVQRFLALRKGGVLTATAGALALGWMAIGVSAQPRAVAAPGAAGFLQPGQFPQ